MTEIQPGHVIQGPRWPEPVEVKLVEDLGDYVHLVGATTNSGEHVDQLIPRQQLSQLQVARIHTDFTASPREVFLALEARRYRFASLYDPLLAMNTSKVDPLPHQIEAVYGYGRSEVFYCVAQAVSETLSNESKEKKRLDGFLVGHECATEEVAQAARQGRLFE
jgi:hypothetical protein